MGDLSAAQQVFWRYEQDNEITDKRPIFAAMARILLEHGDEKGALAILDRVQPPPPMSDENEIIEWALLFKRSGRLQQAHQIFASSYDRLRDNPKALHEFAQTKMRLTRETRHKAIRRQLNLEAAELLRRAIQISSDATRTAWCWFDLAQVLIWLRAPEAEIAQAYERALSLLPGEPRFVSGRAQWQNRRSASAMN
jgi:ATP-dependent DNA helicase RecG